MKSFSLYLENNQKRYDYLFTQEELQLISQRRDEIGLAENERENGPLHDMLTNLVAFLNYLLPESWRLGYNDKTAVINSFSNIFTSKAYSNASSNGGKERFDIISTEKEDIQTPKKKDTNVPFR